VVALHPGGVIDAVHFSPLCEAAEAPQASSLQTVAATSYQDARADFEREYLRQVLATANGNVSEAARISGIPRQNLYVRMKRWGFVTE
jgi:DNA-binding NtrC family response regulator